MEEEYWEKFVASGTIMDYLYYKGLGICGQVMKRYEDAKDRSGFVESDCGDRDGALGKSHWRI